MLIKTPNSMKKLFPLFAGFLCLANVAISQSITVTVPNGGESWTGCSTQNITWTFSGTGTLFSIDYSTDGGTTWASVTSFYSATGGSGSFAWLVPSIGSTNCLVRVKDSNDPATDDVSNTTFTIIAPILLTSPNGSESLGAGATHIVTWTEVGTSNFYDIDYSIDAGASWIVIANNYNTITATYNWTIPNNPSATCLLRVTDANDICMTDESDNLFTIINDLAVTSPNGAESYQAVVGTQGNIINMNTTTTYTVNS
ncbi:MAG: hypothetical protein COA57_16345, partial [Flavobacteriales bacterium]